MNFCPNCGARIPGEEDLFCMNCGYKLPKEDGAPAAQAKEPPARVGGDTAEFTVAPVFQPVVPEPEEKAAPAALFPDEPVQTMPAGQQADDLLHLIDEVQAEPEGPAVSPAAVPLFAEVPPASEAARRPAAPRQEPPAMKPPPPPAARPAASPPPVQPAKQPPAPQQAAAALPRPVVPPPSQQTIPQAPPVPPPAPTAPDATQAAMQQTQPNLFAQQPAPQRYSTPAATHGTDLFAQEAAAPPPRRRVPTPPPVELPEDRPPRRSPVKIVLTVVIVLVIFLVAVSVTTLVMLYFSNRPAKTIDTFAQAVEAADHEALNGMVVLEGAPSSQQGWDAFCDAFAQTASLNRLRSQLLKLSGEPDATGLTYPAVGIEAEDFFLFIKRYHITIQGVDLLAPGAPAGTVAQLNGTGYNGTATDEGMLFEGLMPGLYSCSLSVPGAAEPSGDAVEIELFEVDGPNRLESVDAQHATVTVENCRSDDAVITINGAPVSDKPVNGVLTLSNVAVGSTIKIWVTEEDGTHEATVTFSDLATTTLRFGEYTRVSGEEDDSSDASEEAEDDAVKFAEGLSKSSIDELLAIFYKSYLDCINAQSMDAIQISTAANNSALATRIKYDGNVANLFEFSSASCDAQSITAKELDGKPCVEVNGTFGYKYKPREGDEALQAATNRQSVQFVYDGQWLVNAFIFVTDGDFDAHKTADFSAE